MAQWSPGAGYQKNIYVNVKYTVDKAGDVHQETTKTIEGVKNVGRTQEKLSRTYKKGTKTQKKATTVQRGFRMELLSTMFAGMALQKATGQYVDRVMELTGVTDMMGAAMDMVMISTIEPFLPMLYDFAEGLMNMSEAEKQTLGMGILMGNMLGGVVMSMSQLLLFLDAVELMGGLPGFFKTFTSVFTSLGKYAGKALETTWNFIPGEGWGKFKSSVGLVAGAFALKGVIEIITEEDVSATGICTTLGLSTVSGYMLGGPYGALAAYSVAVVFAFTFKREQLTNVIGTIMNTVSVLYEDFFRGLPFGLGVGIAEELASKRLERRLEERGGKALILPAPVTKYVTMEEIGDFISRPEGITRFSPDDTIIGAKDIGGLGGNVSVEVNIYGGATSEAGYDIGETVGEAVREEMRGVMR